MSKEELEAKVTAMTGGVKGLGMSEDEWNAIVLQNR